MKSVLIIFVLFFTSLSNIGNTKYKVVIINEQINDNSLLSYIKKIGIAHPKIVLTQAKLESANFKSKLFKSNNNIFGMKYPERRKTTAIGVNRNHSVYSSWKEAVIDYKIWQDTYAKKYIKSKKQYLKYLSLYAEDKNYVNKIEKNLL